MDVVAKKAVIENRSWDSVRLIIFEFNYLEGPRPDLISTYKLNGPV